MQGANLADAFDAAKSVGKSVCIMIWKRMQFRVSIERIETPDLEHPSPRQTTAIQQLEHPLS